MEIMISLKQEQRKTVVPMFPNQEVEFKNLLMSLLLTWIHMYTQSKTEIKHLQYWTSHIRIKTKKSRYVDNLNIVDDWYCNIVPNLVHQVTNVIFLPNIHYQKVALKVCFGAYLNICQKNKQEKLFCPIKAINLIKLKGKVNL